ncbi:MAG: L,D-transpeptidase family protein [Rhizobiaceae bacterium]|nr:L,D-transpeptidase family protein [Rhizobiaceae bacterium]MCV0407046.1 L,D-transpeptidase family protein [Rhizobiaceae bacterium]
MTPIRKPGLSLLAAAVFSTGLSAAPAPALSQNLFDMLFGGPVRRERSYPPQPRQPAPPQRQRKVAAPKITGPSYYSYKPDALVKVDFSGLPSTTQAVPDGAEGGSDGFTAALVHLAGFDLYAEKDVAKALVEHYGANPDFAFVEGMHVGARGQQALDVLRDAARHGLDPADYTVEPPSSAYSSADPDGRRRDLVRFEMRLAARLLRYASDVHRGRINPNRISGYHDLPVKEMDMAGLLRDLSTSTDVAGRLARLEPRADEYRILMAELEALEAADENEIVVDPETFLRPGGSSPEFPKLLKLIERQADDAFRAEHGPLLAAWWSSETYDKSLVPLIKAAQKANDLNPDGVIGPRTVEALAGVTKADRIERVIIALEQLRWLPSDLGDTRVFINAAGFEATYRENGAEKLSMRVVVGTKANQTSFFYDEIERVEYNPYWGVPKSILVNEMLPRLRSDPGYLDRAGYEVTDSSGRRIPSSAINWSQYGSNIPYNVRQTPSERNALGELKIMFPNKHAIYMHDTPQKNLFERDTRAYSHGCVRLADPRGMAAAVLGKPIAHVEEKLGKGHSSESVERKIPVYVAYFTAWPNASGTVGYHGDVYGRDARVRSALDRTGEERRPTG